MGKAENDQLCVFGDVSSAKSSPPKGGEEQRRATRYMVSWRAAISLDGQNFHYGRLKDISPYGAAILYDINIKPDTHITLKIYIPTIDKPSEPKVMIVRGVTVYTVYDAERLCFRTGISFVKSGQASECAYLEGRLKTPAIAEKDHVRRRSADRAI